MMLNLGWHASDFRRYENAGYRLLCRYVQCLLRIQRIPYLLNGKDESRETGEQVSGFGNRYANRRSTESQLPIHVALEFKFDATSASANPVDSSHQDKSVSDVDRSPKLHVLHAAKAEEISFQEIQLSRIKTAQLSSTLTHHNARHQREVGHVTADPELVLRDVFESDQPLALHVNVDDARQLLHLKTLRIDLANLLETE